VNDAFHLPGTTSLFRWDISHSGDKVPSGDHTIYLVDDNSAILKSTAKTKMEGR
jgi:hypothetical protein